MNLLSAQSAKHAMSSSVSINAFCLEPVFTPCQFKDIKLVTNVAKTHGKMGMSEDRCSQLRTAVAYCGKTVHTTGQLQCFRQMGYVWHALSLHN